MYFVYILKSLKDGRTYVGFAENWKSRLKEHNQGKTRATRSRRPFIIIYLEKIDTLKDAKERELYWKSGAGRRNLKKYFRDGFPPVS